VTVHLPRYNPGQTADIIVPSLANSIGLAPLGVSDAAGTWVQISSGLATEFVLLGAAVHVRSGASASQFFLMQVEVGTGAAASEVPIAGFSYAQGEVFAASGQGAHSGSVQRCAPVRIPASTRIAGRASVNVAAGVSAPAIYLYGYDPALYELETPGPYGLMGRERYYKGLKALTNSVYFDPVLGRHTVTAGVGTFVMGSWANFITTTAVPLWVTKITALNPADVGSLRFQFDLGVNEVVVAKAGLPGVAGTFGFCQDAELPRPVYVPPGANIDVRSASSTSGKAVGAFLTLEPFL
jgi:hypothetical protein